MHICVCVCVCAGLDRASHPPSIGPTLLTPCPPSHSHHPPHTPPPLCLCNPCQLAPLANPSALISWATHPVRDRTGTGADRGGTLSVCVCICVCVCACACVWGGGWCRPESINWSLCLRLGAVCLCVSQLPVPPRPSIPYLSPSPSPLDPYTYIPTWLIYVYFTSWAFCLPSWFCLEQI